MKNNDTVSTRIDSELVSRISSSYGIDSALAERIVEHVLVSFGATMEEWVRSRHIRLQRQGMKNADIYRTISEELPFRRFASSPLSERQIRRMIYG